MFGLILATVLAQAPMALFTIDAPGNAPQVWIETHPNQWMSLSAINDTGAVRTTTAGRTRYVVSMSWVTWWDHARYRPVPRWRFQVGPLGSGLMTDPIAASETFTFP
jgi:hypothetical protein